MKTLIAAIALLAAASVHAQQKDMSFFVTSAGPGKGADLGGLDGRRPHCQTLAQGGRRRRARPGAPTSARSRRRRPVNARDRIGTGPWQNAKGVVIAQRRRRAARRANNLNKQTALTEKGAAGQRPRRHAEPARHPDRLAARRHGVSPADEDMTCGNWTKSGEGAAMVGHHDRVGPDDDRAGEVLELVAPVARLQPGCAARELGGDGLFYCFAAK